MKELVKEKKLLVEWIFSAKMLVNDLMKAQTIESLGRH